MILYSLWTHSQRWLVFSPIYPSEFPCCSIMHIWEEPGYFSLWPFTGEVTCSLTSAFPSPGQTIPESSDSPHISHTPPAPQTSQRPSARLPLSSQPLYRVGEPQSTSKVVSKALSTHFPSTVAEGWSELRSEPALTEIRLRIKWEDGNLSWH